MFNDTLVPGWLEGELSSGFRSVTYGPTRVHEYREYVRRVRLELPVIAHDEGVLGFLGSETMTPQGRQLLKEITTCRDDHIGITMAMGNWKLLPQWFMDSIPYAVTIPDTGIGVVHVRKVPPNGIDYEKGKTNQFGLYPWKYPTLDCEDLGCENRDWSRLTWPQIPEDSAFWRAYEPYKHQERDRELDQSGVTIAGKTLKDLHQGEAHQAQEDKTKVAQHLLQYLPDNLPSLPGPLHQEGPIRCPTCLRFEEYIDREGMDLTKRPTFEMIRKSLSPCGMNVVIIAQRRLERAARAAGGGDPAAPPLEPAIEP